MNRSILAERHLTRTITAYRVSQCLAVVTRLNIPDMLENGPCSVESISIAIGVNAQRLERVLRFLATENIFVETEGKFALTAVSRLLCRSSDSPFRQWLLCELQCCYWESWLGLEEALRGARSGFEATHHQPFFEYLAGNPESAVLFHETMTSLTQTAAPIILEQLDFSEVRTVVDVGGGEGLLLAEILTAHPHLHGVLYDQAPAQAERVAPLRGFMTDGRARVESGDFFDEVPANGDMYLLKKILHDWDDPDAIRILTNCRRAMSSGSRLVAVETLVDEQGKGRGLDVLMLILLGGKERTRDEFAKLFHKAGFELAVVHQAGRHLSILEAHPNE